MINWFFFTIMLFLNSIEFLSLYLASQPQLMKFESILSKSRALWKQKNFRRGLRPLRPPLGGSERPPDSPAPFGLPTLACCSLRSLFRRFFLHVESCLVFILSPIFWLLPSKSGAMKRVKHCKKDSGHFRTSFVKKQEILCEIQWFVM